MTDPMEKVYRAHRAALEAEAEVFDDDNEARIVERLRGAIDAARKATPRAEVSFRLQVIAGLLAKVRHPDAVVALLHVLADDDPSVRARAVQAFRSASERDFAAVLAGAERALDSGLDPDVLLDLPGLLVDCAPDEVAPVDVLVRLVEHDDADVAAEAICAIAELDLAGVEDLLESLSDDDRPLGDPGAGPRTVGELVREVLAGLRPVPISHAGEA